MRRATSDLRIYENQTGAHPHRALPQRRKKRGGNTSLPEGRETRDRFKESLQINTENVSCSELHEYISPSTCSELKDLNICAYRLSLQWKFILFISRMSKWGEATLKTRRSIRNLVKTKQNKKNPLQFLSGPTVALCSISYCLVLASFCVMHAVVLIWAEFARSIF